MWLQGRPCCYAAVYSWHGHCIATWPIQTQCKRARDCRNCCCVAPLYMDVNSTYGSSMTYAAKLPAANIRHNGTSQVVQRLVQKHEANSLCSGEIDKPYRYISRGSDSRLLSDMISRDLDKMSVEATQAASRLSSITAVTKNPHDEISSSKFAYKRLEMDQIDGIVNRHNSNSEPSPPAGPHQQVGSPAGATPQSRQVGSPAGGTPQGRQVGSPPGGTPQGRPYTPQQLAVATAGEEEGGPSPSNSPSAASPSAMPAAVDDWTGPSACPALPISSTLRPNTQRKHRPPLGNSYEGSDLGYNQLYGTPPRTPKKHQPLTSSDPSAALSSFLTAHAMPRPLSKSRCAPRQGCHPHELSLFTAA